MAQPEFPELDNGQAAVLLCDVWTGIVLGPDFQYRTGSGEAYLVFRSEGEAKAWAEQLIIRRPQVECVVHDQAGRPVATYRNLAWVKQEHAKAMKRKKNWLWMFWTKWLR